MKQNEDFFFSIEIFVNVVTLKMILWCVRVCVSTFRMINFRCYSGVILHTPDLKIYNVLKI